MGIFPLVTKLDFLGMIKVLLEKNIRQRSRQDVLRYLTAFFVLLRKYNLRYILQEG